MDDPLVPGLTLCCVIGLPPIGVAVALLLGSGPEAAGVACERALARLAAAAAPRPAATARRRRVTNEAETNW